MLFKYIVALFIYTIFYYRAKIDKITSIEATIKLKPFSYMYVISLVAVIMEFFHTVLRTYEMKIAMKKPYNNK